jgi:hypothetical protein
MEEVLMTDTISPTVRAADEYRNRATDCRKQSEKEDLLKPNAHDPE